MLFNFIATLLNYCSVLMRKKIERSHFSAQIKIRDLSSINSIVIFCHIVGSFLEKLIRKKRLKKQKFLLVERNKAKTNLNMLSGEKKKEEIFLYNLWIFIQQFSDDLNIGTKCNWKMLAWPHLHQKSSVFLLANHFWVLF